MKFFVCFRTFCDVRFLFSRHELISEPPALAGVTKTAFRVAPARAAVLLVVFFATIIRRYCVWHTLTAKGVLCRSLYTCSRSCQRW